MVAGGVSANSFLKQKLSEVCKENNIELYMPELRLCTDNAAMIASAGYYYILKGKGLSNLGLTGSATVAL